MATQTTINTASTTYLNKTYYDRNLLENAKTKFIHAQFSQKRSIPKNSGKTVEFRRWTNFDPKLITPGLTEGVTPSAQSLAQTNVTATCAQYGAYVEVSDMLKTSSYDDVMTGSTDLLGEQVGTALDWIVRDELCSGTNVQYAGTSHTKRYDVASTDKLTFSEIRKAVRTLKKKKAKMFTGEGRDHFVAIVSPDAVYDLQSETEWLAVSEYSDKEKLYAGEIGTMYGVRFIESTEAKVWKEQTNKVKASTSTSATFELKDDPTDEMVAYLSVGGNKIYVGSTEYTLATSGSYTPATKTVKLSGNASLTADDVVKCENAGASGADIHACLVMGKDAYGTIDIDGGGNVHTIIKAPGSAGTSDPLNQRATVGAKVDSFTSKILNGDWIVRIEHGVTA